MSSHLSPFSQRAHDVGAALTFLTPRAAPGSPGREGTAAGPLPAALVPGAWCLGSEGASGQQVVLCRLGHRVRPALCILCILCTYGGEGVVRRAPVQVQVGACAGGSGVQGEQVQAGACV